jgi:hypothetical protein
MSTWADTLDHAAALGLLDDELSELEAAVERAAQACAALAAAAA